MNERIEQARKYFLIIVHGAGAVERVVWIAEIRQDFSELRFCFVAQIRAFESGFFDGIGDQSALAARAAQDADPSAAFVALHERLASEKTDGVDQLV